MPSAEDCATLQAWFEGVDHAEDEATAEWGRDRLPLLVSDDMRAKFNRQRLRWSEAYQAAWNSDRLTKAQLDAVENAAGGMRRAWGALSAAASEAGHRPIAPDVWETTLEDGTVAAIVRTDAEASKVVADGRHLVVYTLAEVAQVINALPAALQLAKIHFPGAQVRTPSDKSWVKAGDPIPF